MTTKVRGSVLANTAVVAGTYGGNTEVAVITVDAQGRITYASNVIISSNGSSANLQPLYDLIDTKYDKIGGTISGQIITTGQFLDGGEF